MHIGFLSLEAPFGHHIGGGIATYLRTIIPELAAMGHRVTVVAAASSEVPAAPSPPATEGRYEARSNGERELVLCDGMVRQVEIRLPSLHWYVSRAPAVSAWLTLPVRPLEWSLALGRRARSVFERHPPDIVESQETGALSVVRGRLAPTVIRLHGSSGTFRRFTG